MKKKMLIGVVAFMLVVSLAACGGKDAKSNETNSADTKTENAVNDTKTEKADGDNAAEESKQDANDAAKEKSDKKDAPEEKTEEKKSAETNVSYDDFMEIYNDYENETDESKKREQLDKIQAILDSVSEQQ